MEISVGPIECLFDRSTLFLRRIRWNGVEVVRAIYAAVRDRNWQTVPPRLESFSVNHEDDRVVIQFAALCEQDRIVYAYQAAIEIRAAGEVRFEFTGEARSDFRRNRIGLCVLHPIELCAGTRCTVEHTHGGREAGEFPRLVRPDQPFKDIRTLRHAVDQNTSVEIGFEGEVFEMEDQRNWTDASYKTYGTPLSLPFPQPVRRGDKLSQTVTVKFLNSVTSRISPVKTARPALKVDFERTKPKPRIGLCASSAKAISPTLLSAFQRLSCDHLRVDCNVGENGWESTVSAAAASARAIGAGLHVAAFLGENAEEELRALSGCCLRVEAPVKAWLIFGRNSKTTPQRLGQLAEQILPRAPDVALAAGTNAYFAELNRERPPRDANWHPCFSLNPQVHASDEVSMIENLEAQPEVVRSAGAFARLPVLISPITLRPRFNPNATDTREVSSNYDPRQSSLFCAEWTLGSIAALAQETKIHSITYYEMIGPGGVISSAAEIYPVYHVFAAVAELSEFAECSLEGASGSISALAGRTPNGANIILAANHNSAATRVQLATGSGQARLQKLTDGEQAKDREFWKNSPVELCAPGEIELPAGGIVRIELI